MRKSIIVALLVLLQFNHVLAQSGKGYEYKVDLTNVQNDRVQVELTAPKIKSAEVVYYMPKIIPGTYSIADYGRFISDFKAMDKKGNALTVEKLTDNSWKILNATKLNKISYWVDDSYDNPPPGPTIYPMAGSNIEEGKNFVINTSGYFGYLDGEKDAAFTVRIIRPENFYGSTGLIAKSTGNPVSKIDKEKKETPGTKREDVFKLENYDRLIDSPIMYSKPDTAVIKVGGTEVLIGSYSPNGKITGKEIAATVKDVLMAQKDYLGGNLPVDKYAFIFYFTDQPITGYGALEHSYSSFYFMPERTLADMKQQLRDFAAHEFFHIVTPLTIHSQEIEKFDFNDPKMSKHLWLYEGVTEYFAGHVQVRSGLITQQEYLTIIRGKMNTSTAFYKDDLPFTELSLKTLGEHEKEYGNVYQKGALIGMCLDILLRKNSGGKYGMRDLAADLSKKYGKNAAFNDSELFDQITAMTYPEIGEFFKKHVEGAEKLPFSELLPLVGIKYVPEETYRDVSLGLEVRQSNFIKVPEKDNRIFFSITDSEALNEQGKTLGFKSGDLVTAINNEPMPASGITAFMNRQREKLKPGSQLNITVLRKNESGTYTEMTLTAPVIEIDRSRKNMLSFDENATPEQLALRKAWLEP